jgi:hypothetical protein
MPTACSNASPPPGRSPKNRAARPRGCRAVLQVGEPMCVAGRCPQALACIDLGLPDPGTQCLPTYPEPVGDPGDRAGLPTWFKDHPDRTFTHLKDGTRLSPNRWPGNRVLLNMIIRSGLCAGRSWARVPLPQCRRVWREMSVVVSRVGLVATNTTPLLSGRPATSTTSRWMTARRRWVGATDRGNASTKSPAEKGHTS